MELDFFNFDGQNPAETFKVDKIRKLFINQSIANIVIEVQDQRTGDIDTGLLMEKCLSITTNDREHMYIAHQVGRLFGKYLHK